MRLDVVQRRAFDAGDRIKRAELPDKQLSDCVRGQVSWPPTETLAVVEPGVGTDRNVISDRRLYGCPHAVRIARVKSAGDVGGTHQLK